MICAALRQFALYNNGSTEQLINPVQDLYQGVYNRIQNCLDIEEVNIIGMTYYMSLFGSKQW